MFRLAQLKYLHKVYTRSSRALRKERPICQYSRTSHHPTTEKSRASTTYLAKTNLYSFHPALIDTRRQSQSNLYSEPILQRQACDWSSVHVVPEHRLYSMIYPHYY